jgi:ferritin-like metal-binding protein YciE
MAKESKTLDVLFHDTLKDVYFAEHKIVATLPKMPSTFSNVMAMMARTQR